MISIPPTVFRQGEAAGVQSQRLVSKALAAEGFLVFQVEHRLAPMDLLEGQTAHSNTIPEGIASGRPPQQTNDIKQQILAALADSKCNQKIYLVGGSSGGSHALFCALDPTPTVPTWSGSKVSKIKAVVSLSGPTDLSSRTGDPDIVPRFEDSVENYTNFTRVNHSNDWAALQYGVSPIKLVATATYFPPIHMYGTLGDSVPYQQGEAMYDALFAKGAVVKFYKINNGSLHAFKYWNQINEVTGECVRACHAR